MKKVENWYFLLVTVGSVLIYKLIEMTNGAFGEALVHLIGKDEPMPVMTNWVFEYSLWPLVISAISVICLFVLKQAVLQHVVVVLLIMLVIGLVVTLAGYAMPFAWIHYELGS